MKKFFCVENIWTVFKIGAYFVFALLVILFFFLFPVSLESCANPKIGEMYMTTVYVLIAYLGIFFLLLILRKIKSKGFKITVATLSILIFISSGFLINTATNNQRIQRLENNWFLSLPHDAKLEFFDSHSLGFVDQDRYKYYVFKLKSQWMDTTNFLNNYFPHNISEMRYINFPEQRDKTGFRLVFQELLKESLFDLPSKVCPEWDEPFQWGMRINGNRILLGISYPKTMRLILFELVSYY